MLFPNQIFTFFPFFPIFQNQKKIKKIPIFSIFAKNTDFDANSHPKIPSKTHFLTLFPTLDSFSPFKTPFFTFYHFFSLFLTNFFKKKNKKKVKKLKKNTKNIKKHRFQPHFYHKKTQKNYKKP